MSTLQVDTKSINLPILFKEPEVDLGCVVKRQDPTMPMQQKRKQKSPCFFG
jgi:hypothetical protein